MRSAPSVQEHGRSQSLGAALSSPKPWAGVSAALRQTVSAAPHFRANVAWDAARESLLGATSHEDVVRALRRLHDFSTHWQADTVVKQHLIKFLEHSLWTIVMQAARLLLSDGHLSLPALADLGDHLKIDQSAEEGRRLLTGLDGTWSCAPALLVLVLTAADPRVRRLAPFFCLHRDGVDALPQLADFSRDQAPDVRKAVLGCLDVLQSAASLQDTPWARNGTDVDDQNVLDAGQNIVKSLRQDPDHDVRRWVARWLVCHSENAIETWTPMLGDADPTVEATLHRGLQKFWQGSYGNPRTPSDKLRAIATAGGTMAQAATAQLAWRRVPLAPRAMLADNLTSDHVNASVCAPFESCRRTHGVELEYVMDPPDAAFFINRLPRAGQGLWQAAREASLEKPGCETASPILTYGERAEVMRAAAELRHQGAYAGISSGLHVHVGIAGLHGAQLRQLAYVAQRYDGLLAAALCVSRSRRETSCEPIDAAWIDRVALADMTANTPPSAFLQALTGEPGVA